MPAPADVVLRSLRPGERGAFLDLLGGWERPSGWPGAARDFFRRYVESDPTFADEHAWVAERGGRLVACAQIFPRALRIGGARVPTAGIGSVFTRPEARGGGIASALLERVLAAARARGMELALLFASRHGFYERLGFSLWTHDRPLWLRADDTARPDPGRRIAPFDPRRDLDAAFALHGVYSAALDGSAVRDRAFFAAQLAFAGNPAEDFVVARDAGGALAAYARGAVLSGIYLVTELARRPEPAAAEALADLVLALMQPRDPDPLAPPGRPSAALRQVLVAPALADAALDAALARRRVGRSRFAARDAMFAVLDAAALARRLGVPRRPGEDDAAWLRRVLPPDRFAFWPADRF